MQLSQHLKAKTVLRYMFMPGVIPRIKELANSGFGWIAYTMAIIYYSVRLLPAHHPYLNPQNIGRYGIRNVIGVAANHLVLKKENLDQILIFFALLAGFLILVTQFVLLAFAVVFSPAIAAPIPFAGLFATAEPELDIAFMMMDKVFAVPGMFESKFDPNVIGGISPFNTGLHAMFKFYNMAMLIVAVLIFLYYLFIVVGETAQTGTPFGKRFNHIWAPIRLIAAIGLLVPLAHGYNSAQYITLYSAKWGSGFATTAWIEFNSHLTDGSSGDSISNPTPMENDSFLAVPRAPDSSYLIEFMSLVHACKAAYASINDSDDIDAYMVSSDGETDSPGSYDDAVEFYSNSDIFIRFGHQRPPAEDEGTYTGNVRHDCGEIRVSVSGSEDEDAKILQEAYYDIVIELWEDENLEKFGKRAAAINIHDHDNRENPCSSTSGITGESGSNCQDSDEERHRLPDAGFRLEMTTTFNQKIQDAVEEARAERLEQLESEGKFEVSEDILKHGWGGAGMWYNHIAEWNGALVSLVINTPTISQMPWVMERVEEEKAAANENVDARYRYNPYIAEEGGESRPIEIGSREREIDVAKTLNHVYLYWYNSRSHISNEVQNTGNIFFDAINAIFGTTGLFELRANKETHPLAQLVAIGKSMIETTIRNLLGALAASAAGGMLEIMGQHRGSKFAYGISKIFLGLVTVSITIGFILYYILPFLPFMYFFFGLGGWVKGIFEAMVGVPLWALAHLRIDGNGLPGDSAMNGYFLIFEIFIRPILVVFGLVASVVIFTAQVRVLNEIFDLVTVNLTGFDCMDCVNAKPDSTAAALADLQTRFRRNVIDEFFFTIIYTILVYSLATSSFKLIDQIPQSILRWMGASVQNFNDQRDDPAQGLTQYIAFGGQSVTNQGIQALQQGAKTAGMIVGLPFGLSSRNGGATATGDRTGTPPPGGTGTVAPSE